MKKINAKNKRVLVIPDLHIPFEHKDAYNFLKAIKEKWLDKKDHIVLNLGDEIDGNQISFHDKDPDMMFSPASELELAIKRVGRFYRLFPEMHICESNHGSLVYRRAKKHGLPYHVLKSYSEILGTPNWSWHEDILLKTEMGDVYLCHGKSSQTGKLAKEMNCHAIQGHYHSRYEITFHKTVGREIYNAFVGCLVSYQDLAFSYAKTHLPKPILGAMIISEHGYPFLVKMNLNSNLRWDGKLPSI